jgi:hypothetical protein
MIASRFIARLRKQRPDLPGLEPMAESALVNLLWVEFPDLREATSAAEFQGLLLGLFAKRQAESERISDHDPLEQRHLEAVARFVSSAGGDLYDAFMRLRESDSTHALRMILKGTVDQEIGGASEDDG